MAEILGVLVGTLALLYMVFIGQTNIRDWWKNRHQKESPDSPSKNKQKILHNLPSPEYGEFVGRESEVEELAEKLKPYPKSQHAVITIDGIGGVGKSVLALEMAHRYLRSETGKTDELFEAIIWTSAKQSVLTADGIHAKKYSLRTLQDIFNTIAATLEREDINRTEDDQKEIHIRQALTKQRTLLIIDNLETVDDEAVLDFLREIPAPTKVIVTTRHRIDVAYPIRLHGMPESDAVRLMQHECQKKTVMLSRENRTTLFERTGGIPLAMVWSIAKMGLGYSFEAIIADLGSPRADVALFCFDAAVSTIKKKSAYKLLLTLGLFASSASRDALGKITGMDKNVLDRDDGLVTLEKLSLVNKHADRFALLPLTKSYVIGELAAQGALKKELGQSWVDYLKSLCGDPEDAIFWRWKNLEFKEDGENILAAIDYAYENCSASDVFHLAFGGIEYLEIVGFWPDTYQLAKRMLSLAETTGKSRIAARFFGDMGWLSQQWGNYERAEKEFKLASEIFNDLKHDEGICKSHVWFSTIQRKKGNYEKSEQYCLKALDLAEKLESEDMKVDAKLEYGKLLRDLGRLNEAWECFDYVRKWGESLVAGAPHNQSFAAGVWGHLAGVELKRKNYQSAYDLCIKSLPFFEERGSKGFGATLKHRMALADFGLGRKQDARKNACEALYWYKRLGMIPDVKNVEELVAKLGGCDS